MGAFKYIRENEKSIYRDKDRQRELVYALARSSSIERPDGPTKLAKARSIGYKAKRGYIVVRVRVNKGSFRRVRPVHARRPSKTGIYYNLSISKKKIAENRAAKRYPNMDILGSYFLGDNGKYQWYEVVMHDRLAK